MSRTVPIRYDRIIIIGRTCSGKTTFGKYVAEKYGYRHIDASDIVMGIRGEQLSGQELAQYAQSLFDLRGKDVIARTISALLENEEDSNVVISGFRTIEELGFIDKVLYGSRIVYIKSSRNTRYQRYKNRYKQGEERTWGGFLRKERSDLEFGVIRVANYLSDIVCKNESDLPYFLRCIGVIVGDKSQYSAPGVVFRSKEDLQRQLAEDLRFACIYALFIENRAVSAKQLTRIVLSSTNKLTHKDVSRELSTVPAYVQMVETGKNIRYRISDSGKILVLLVLRRVFESEAAPMPTL